MSALVLPGSDRSRCLQTYSRSKVVAYYRNHLGLEKPEEAILRLLEPRLSRMRLLDVGVGGGRITEHFAPLAADYRGIDLSPRMVDACRKRFAGRIAEDRFSVRDMRELHRYAVASFDLVLLTYNTIDHLSHAERPQFLRQARRVTAQDGYFCFSTHNVRSLEHTARRGSLAAGFWRQPLKAIRTLRHRAKFLRLNRAALAAAATADHVVINNGTHEDFGLQIYYIRPSVQMRELTHAGFRRIQVFSLDSGEELEPCRVDEAPDRWLYYLCC